MFCGTLVFLFFVVFLFKVQVWGSKCKVGKSHVWLMRLVFLKPEDREQSIGQICLGFFYPEAVCPFVELL